MNNETQARLRFILRILGWLITSGQWVNALNLLVSIIREKRSWDEFIARANGSWYDKQVQDAVAEYKAKVHWTDKPTTNIPGFDKWRKDNT